MSHQITMPEIAVGETEHHELTALAMAGRAEAADELLNELERARIVPDRDVPTNVVRMGSSVAYRPDNGEDREVTLVYPAEADISAGKVSVLTPIGTALIGLEVGQAITWLARDGREHVLTVLSVRQAQAAD